MDCFFHHAVPSVTRCTGCSKPLCATCRGEGADCASCRLGAKIDNARRAHVLEGEVGPSYGTYSAPPPPDYGHRPARQRTTVVATVRPETRALVALSYPFWPLALLALLDSRGSRFVKRQAWQALGFNFGMYGLGALISAAAALPLIGIGAWPLVPFIVPVAVVASVIYAFKVWNGEDVDVPIVSEWVDARLPA